MKIIQLLQKPQLRGAEIFACQLSNHLTQQGHEVIVVTIFSGDSELPFMGKIINLNRPLSKRFYDIKGWKKFALIVKDFKPDIVQANAADTLKFAVSTKLLFSLKDIQLVFRNANKMGDFITSNLKWRLNNFYLSQMAYVISVSKECEKDFIKTFSFPKSKISTIEIGVEEKKIGNIPKDLKKIFKRGPILSHIGGFVPEKNHEGLLRIFIEILKNNPGAQLLLMGKGKLEAKIKSKVEELQIKENIHFLGYRNDVLEILHHSKVFVLPSLIEGLPAVIIESMYCETPVVAYDVGGVREIVNSDMTGWLVKKNNVKGMIESIEEVLNNGDSVERKIQAGKTRVLEEFMNEKIAERFLQVYNKNVKL